MVLGQCERSMCESPLKVDGLCTKNKGVLGERVHIGLGPNIFRKLRFGSFICDGFPLVGPRCLEAVHPFFIQKRFSAKNYGFVENCFAKIKSSKN